RAERTARAGRRRNAPLAVLLPVRNGPCALGSGPGGGRVTGYRLYRHEEPFAMRLGGSLPGFQIAYETWGRLSPARDNAVLLTTGLSPGSHARSHADAPGPGWWEEFVGPGLALDTDRFFVVCSNVLG